MGRNSQKIPLFHLCLGKPYLLFLLAISFLNQAFSQESLVIADQRLDTILPLLKDKKVGLIVNHSAKVGKKHLVDTLLSHGIKIQRIFAPEHGFRGDADAGEQLKNDVDPISGISIFSLYGQSKRPTKEALQDIDILVFDIQDVGARFFTYLSTLYYCMDAAAEFEIPVLVLDRPNPNIQFTQGPVLDPKFKTFVGILPIPVLHGMTLGELALMINGKAWLTTKKQCKLSVLPCLNYTRSTVWFPDFSPSPNLPNAKSIQLYASLCLFEGTKVSVGRGTLFPFQVMAIPDSTIGGFNFTPISIAGMAKKPMYEGKKCFGFDLRTSEFEGGFSLSFLYKMYKASHRSKDFFNKFFDNLAGNEWIRKDILAGKKPKSIEKKWKKELAQFEQDRVPFLLYP